MKVKRFPRTVAVANTAAPVIAIALAVAPYPLKP